MELKRAQIFFIVPSLDVTVTVRSQNFSVDRIDVYIREQLIVR